MASGGHTLGNVWVSNGRGAQTAISPRRPCRARIGAPGAELPLWHDSDVDEHEHNLFCEKLVSS